MRLEMICCNGKKIPTWDVSMPPSHEDYHDAERAGIVLADVINGHGDYWDDTLVFCKPGDLDDVRNAIQ